MRNRHHRLATRFGRGLIFSIGVLGGFAAVDAALLVFFFLLLALFVEPANPYVGLVLIIGLPIVGLVGGGVAWGAYTLLSEHTAPADAGEHHVHV